MSTPQFEKAQSRTENLANALRIGAGELDGISHEIIGGSGEGGVLYGYITEFPLNAPIQIFKKIKG